MGHNNYFQFKQFRVEQNRAAMRVNTDGVLLGAWVRLENVASLLDVGTGTGLIALMMAQRCNAQITGIDIDEDAIDDAVENAAKSPWADRISIIHDSFQHLSASSDQQFDAIVSNPPYFSNSLINKKSKLSVARHNHALPFVDLIKGAKKMLSPLGRLSVILPVEEASSFIDQAGREGIFMTRLTKVKPFPEKDPNRYLMEFGLSETESDFKTISVFNDSKTEYSDEFAGLVKDFYLKM